VAAVAEEEEQVQASDLAVAGQAGCPVAAARALAALVQAVVVGPEVPARGQAFGKEAQVVLAALGAD
jgi:hypothetical protein